MSQDSKKIEKNEQEAKTTELSEQDLEQVAGGASTTTTTKTNTDKLTHKDFQQAG